MKDIRKKGRRKKADGLYRKWNYYLYLVTLLTLVSCGGESSPVHGPSEATLAGILQASESAASPHAKRILRTGRVMTLENREVIRGGCWHYADAVFRRAGYPGSSGRRKTLFSGPKSGPYAEPDLIRPGDWLYYINHHYGDVEHSAIFIAWIDRTSRRAMMLSYAGERRKEPARYKSYNISHVYRITRAGE